MTCQGNSGDSGRSFPVFFIRETVPFSAWKQKKKKSSIDFTTWSGYKKALQQRTKPQIYAFILNINPKYFLPLYLSYYFKDVLKKVNHKILKLSLN